MGGKMSLEAHVSFVTGCIMVTLLVAAGNNPDRHLALLNDQNRCWLSLLYVRAITHNKLLLMSPSNAVRTCNDPVECLNVFPDWTLFHLLFHQLFHMQSVQWLLAQSICYCKTLLLQLLHEIRVDVPVQANYAAGACSRLKCLLSSSYAPNPGCTACVAVLLQILIF